jgi:very-short-patch-repair endonuclease
VVARWQLRGLGLSERAIDLRIANGRLHRIARGIYAVGRPGLSRHGRWMAAVLSCGPHAMLSHTSAAALWGIGTERSGCIEIAVPVTSTRRRPGLHVYRRPGFHSSDTVQRNGIPVTNLVRTLLDLGTCLDASDLERSINEADRRGLIDPEALSQALDAYPGQRGVGKLRDIIDRRTFRLTDSELERRFLPLVDDAGLPMPLTRRRVNGFRVDFYWPDLGMVVETDGLRYHRTPAQQARDRLRDQAHAAAGMTPLRFTHEQVRFEAAYVRSTLLAVARRLEKPHAA